VKCGTHDCGAAATYHVSWPGQPIDFCAPCAVRAWRISEAMNFPLEARPLVPELPSLGALALFTEAADA
jgi:hypothetical protein